MEDMLCHNMSQIATKTGPQIQTRPLFLSQGLVVTCMNKPANSVAAKIEG